MTEGSYYMDIVKDLYPYIIYLPFTQVFKFSLCLHFRELSFSFVRIVMAQVGRVAPLGVDDLCECKVVHPLLPSMASGCS